MNEIPHMPEDKLRKFVDDFCSNRVFTSAHLREGDYTLLSIVFMPIVFGAFDLPEEVRPAEPIKPETPPEPEPPDPIDPITLYEIDWGDIDGTEILEHQRRLSQVYDIQRKEYETTFEKFVFECEQYEHSREEWSYQCIDLRSKWLTDLGIIWEYYSESLPRGINGYQIFASFHIMHKEDWVRTLPAIRKEKERRKSIEL